MDHGIAMLLGQIVFGSQDAYRLETLPTVIRLLREAQAYLEQRHAALRKAVLDQPAPTAVKSAAPPAVRKTRGRPASRANGAGTSPAPVMPLPFGGNTDGENSSAPE